MRIVDMNRGVTMQLGGGNPVFFHTAENALYAGACEKVLLLQPEQLAPFRRIVGIQYVRNRVHSGLAFRCFFVIAFAEHGKIKARAVRFRAPEAQRIDGSVTEAGNRHVVRHCQDRLIVLIFHAQLPIRASSPVHSNRSAESYHAGLVVAPRFPYVFDLEPVIGALNLVSVSDLLLEQAVPVADSDPGAGNSHGCHGIKEAGRKPAEAAVAQSCVRLNFFEPGKFRSELSQSFFNNRFDSQIDQSRVHKPSDQKFHGKIKDLLPFFRLVFHIGVVPGAGHIIHQQRAQGKIFQGVPYVFHGFAV